MVRHGRTAWNNTGRFQGHTDLPLCEGGRAQANALADALASVPFEGAVSSDLRRAVETAQSIARRHPRVTVRTDRRLRELSYGQWEGLTWEQIVARYPAMQNVSLASPSDYSIEEGESFLEMQQRVAEVLVEIRASNARQVLIVTHAGPLHAIMRTLMPDNPHVRVRFEPAGITRLRLQGSRCHVITLNQTAHLAARPRSY